MNLKKSALLLTILGTMQMAHAEPGLQHNIEQQRMLLSVTPSRLAIETGASKTHENQYKAANNNTTSLDLLINRQQLALSTALANPTQKKVDDTSRNVSAVKAAPLANPNDYTGSYFLFFDGQESINLTAGRLQLNANDGQVWFSNGAATFDISVDSEGFLIMPLHQPKLHYESVTYKNGVQVRMQRYLNIMELKPQLSGNGAVVFSGDFQYSDVYPDGEFDTETYWLSISYNAVSSANQLNLANLFPVNQLFNLPLDTRTEVDVSYTNGYVIPAFSTNRSMRVELSEKTAQFASGSWSYLEVDNFGATQLKTEAVTVSFNSDGSAQFTGQSGLTAYASGYTRPNRTEPLLNVLYQTPGSSSSDMRTAIESQFVVKNSNYSHNIPGIYLFKQNGLENEYFWLELYEDGTGISAQTLGQPVNGIYNNIDVVPYLWANAEAENGTVIDMRRYRYRPASGKNGWCIPEQFAPSPQSDCVLYNSRLINFYDLGTVNGAPVVNTEHYHRFYYNSSYYDDFDTDVLNNVQQDNRYFYILQQRPTPLPERPANDSFNSAITLNGLQGQLSATTAGATVEPGENCYQWFCDGASIWYNYTANTDGNLVLSLSAREYSYMAAFTGDSFNNLAEQGSWYSTGSGVELQVDVSAGTTLKIAIADPNNDKGDFNLQWQFTERTYTAIESITFADENLRQCLLSSGYQYAEDVTNLYCYGVSYLGGIEHFVNLRYISLPGEQFGYNNERQLKDLTPLSTLINVEELYLDNNGLTDAMLSVLANWRFGSMYGSARLDLTGNKLTSASIPLLINMLSQQNFTTLSLQSNQLSHIQGLEQLPSLNLLYIGDNPFTNLPQVMTTVSTLTNLGSIGLNRLNLTSLAGLSLPPNLYSLDLSFNPITDLTAVLPYTNVSSLWFLNLNGTALTDASALANLNLAYLYLAQTQISNIDFAASLTNLRYLDLNYTYISSIAPLLALDSLTGVGLWDVVQLPCTELTQLRQTRPEVYIDRQGDLCRVNNGYSIALSEYEGATVTGVSFSDWDGIDYSQYGSLSWQNGVLTFTPKKGLSGYISMNIVIRTPGVGYGYTLRFYIDPALVKKKRRGIPKWLLVLPTSS